MNFRFFGTVSAAALVAFASSPSQAQDALAAFAITNARIVPVSGKVIARGTIVVRNGLIVAVGENVTVPAYARAIDGANLTVYPGFVDGYSSLGMPPASEYVTRPNGYPVAKVRADLDAATLLRADAAAFESRRKAGFGAALAAPQFGVFSGMSAVISLGGTPDPASMVIRAPVAMHLSFDATDPTPGYPGALMGKVAVARQAMYDAQEATRTQEMYTRDPKGRTRPVIARPVLALQPVASGKIPLVVHADTQTEILRALRLAREFKLKPLIEGGQEAYLCIDELKASGATVLLSTNLPKAPTVRRGEEDTSTLQALRLRAQAPRTAGLLAKAGIPFAFTTSGLDNPGEYLASLRKIAVSGLSEEEVVAGATLNAARILGVDRQLGSLETGKIANLVVMSGGLLDPRAKIRHVFVDGKSVDLDGAAPTSPLGLANRAGNTGIAARARVGTAESNPPFPLPPGVTREQALQALRENPDSVRAFLPPGVTVEQAIAGLTGANPQATPRTPREPEVVVPVAPPVVAEGVMPPLPPAVAKSWVLRNATVWTSAKAGVLQNTDVHVRDGKIVAIGQKLSVPGGTTEIDATGKHVTPGMIDCHSHTAIEGGVNEGTNIITAEVRIEDVIDSTDVNIYRQLAGGTTTANLLHGSANAIGGQNAVVKWRWGKKPDELLLAGAQPGIKFALGENPKRSNSRVVEGREPRYPNTRMGVEKVIRDAFLRARDYKRQQADFKAGKIAVAPRRDLQLDTLVEILDGKRLVHSHSYRQDEILMLIRLAEEFGFRVQTFQHVLEGYKVADEMAAHGAGGSTFSDWWAFKIEAWDAIPYNGALMTERGVLTSFNSDSSELARRLNLEAAKAVHYGGMAPEEALKLVTINPAKQLKVDDKIGSLETGKDADIVVWSGSPLSSLAHCEKTFVDGQLYFDRTADLAARPALVAEKKRLSDLERPRPAGRRATPAAPVSASEARPAGNSAARSLEENKAIGPPFFSPPGYPEKVWMLKLTGNGLSDWIIHDRAAKTPATPAGVASGALVIRNATIHPVVGPVLQNATVVVENGKITQVASGNVTAPADAQTVDGTGLHVYPGLFDADTTLGLTEIESIAATNDARELGEFSPELRSIIAVNPDSELIPVARQNGVLNAITAPTGGVLSGMGAVINLDGWTWEDLAVSKTHGLYLNFPLMGQRRFRETAHRCEETAGSGHDEVEHDAAFRSGAFIPAGSYDTRALRLGQPPTPTPTPGGPNPTQTDGDESEPEEPAALKSLNKFIEDARQYQTSRTAGDKGGITFNRDPKFEAMLPVLSGAVPVWVRADRARDITSAVGWAKRNKFKMVLVGGQEADQVAKLLATEKVPVVLGPVLNLPARYDDPYDDAYTLPKRLADAGVTFALSTGDASNVRRLANHAAMAVAYGLDHDQAIRAITLIPAQIAGVGDKIGSIEVGKMANLIITDGDILEITTNVKAAYINGQPVSLNNKHTRLYEKYRGRPRKQK